MSSDRGGTGGGPEGEPNTTDKGGRWCGGVCLGGPDGMSWTAMAEQGNREALAFREGGREGAMALSVGYWGFDDLFESSGKLLVYELAFEPVALRQENKKEGGIDLGGPWGFCTLLSCSTCCKNCHWQDLSPVKAGSGLSISYGLQIFFFLALFCFIFVFRHTGWFWLQCFLVLWFAYIFQSFCVLGILLAVRRARQGWNDADPHKVIGFWKSMYCCLFWYWPPISRPPGGTQDELAIWMYVRQKTSSFGKPLKRDKLVSLDEHDKTNIPRIQQGSGIMCHDSINSRN